MDAKSLPPCSRAGTEQMVLVCHGASDPLIPPAQVDAFEEQMRDTKVDWQLCSYGGAVHSFTNPDADKLDNPAFAYNAAADRRLGPRCFRCSRRRSARADSDEALPRTWLRRSHAERPKPAHGGSAAHGPVGHPSARLPQVCRACARRTP